MKQKEPKFMVGQVVRVCGSPLFRSFLPAYFRVGAIRYYPNSPRPAYRAARGPWVAEKQLRHLNAYEIGLIGPRKAKSA
jgi:hypothetical protein